MTNGCVWSHRESVRAISPNWKNVFLILKKMSMILKTVIDSKLSYIHKKNVCSIGELNTVVKWS